MSNSSIFLAPKRAIETKSYIIRNNNKGSISEGIN
jgi:hypothetical protein